MELNSDEQFDNPYITEGQIKVECLKYHDKNFKFFMMEHHDVKSANSSATETVPKDWPEKFKQAINIGDVVYLEYFPHELKKSTNIPIVGPSIDMWMKQSGIDIFAEMAEIAHSKGATVKIADVASGIFYAWQELAVDQKKWKVEMMKRPMEERYGYAGSLADTNNRIDPIEIEMARAVDARRLMPARAMMQDISKSIVWVGPEAHGKRILHYIQRQTEFELKNGNVEKPEDMVNMCSAEEKIKVEKYKKTFGFNNNIRTYSKEKNGSWRLTDKKKIY